MQRIAAGAGSCATMSHNWSESGNTCNLPTLSHYNPVVNWEHSTTIQPRLHGVARRTVCAPAHSPDEAIISIKIGCGAHFM